MNQTEPPPAQHPRAGLFVQAAEVDGIRSRFFNKWSLFRSKLAGFFSILLVVRFSLAMVLLPAIAMIFIEQGREGLRILATMPDQPRSQVVAFVLALMFLTFMAWYWASILVDVL